MYVYETREGFHALYVQLSTRARVVCVSCVGSGDIFADALASWGGEWKGEGWQAATLRSLLFTQNLLYDHLSALQAFCLRAEANLTRPVGGLHDDQVAAPIGRPAPAAVALGAYRVGASHCGNGPFSFDSEADRAVRARMHPPLGISDFHRHEA